MNADAARAVARELQLEASDRLDSVRFHGLSLLPFLQEDDRVIVAPVRWADIRAGDLITYRFQDKYPTRRAILKVGRRLFLWCENWPARPFQCRAEDVLGRAVARERAGARIDESSAEWQQARRRALWRFPFALPLLAAEVLRCKWRRWRRTP